MAKRRHEVRDPVHGFIDFTEDERRVIDSAPFQRLRHVHQLALSSLVYPGASHKRFEHSLGVMHVAGQIFDLVTRPDKLTDEVRDIVPGPDEAGYGYWRMVLRIAALCHDIGHLPFSHAAESDLLEKGWDHERITYELICSDELKTIFDEIDPSPKPEHVAKLALGPGKVEKLDLDLGGFNTWEAILGQIIVSNVFGADRIDYLLRDSLHTGVAYGRFDHHRLIQTMRILPGPRAGDEIDSHDGEGPEPDLGIEQGGLESAEGLLLARYFMFAQVYYHPTRLIYDQHLKDFLGAWLPNGHFPTDPDGHLSYTDEEVFKAIREAAIDAGSDGHDPARRIVERDHFRIVDSRKSTDIGERSIGPRAVYDRLVSQYGPEHVRFGASPKRGAADDFPVLERDGTSVSALSLSEVMKQLPVSKDEHVFMPRELAKEAKRMLSQEREGIIDQAIEQEKEAEEG